jgi:hypothetical protein
MEILESNISNRSDGSYLLATRGYELPSHRQLAFHIYFHFKDDKVEYSYICRTSVNYRKTTFCFNEDLIYDISSLESMLYSKEEIIQEIMNKTNLYDESIKIINKYCQDKNGNVHKTVYIHGKKDKDDGDKQE